MRVTVFCENKKTKTQNTNEQDTRIPRSRYLIWNTSRPYLFVSRNVHETYIVSKTHAETEGKLVLYYYTHTMI